jgi:hypothetical protein
MTIHLACPSCGSKLKVKDELGGQTRPCPACKQAVQIPLAGAAAPPSTAKPAAAAASAKAKEADFTVADSLFDEDFAKAPTLEEKAAAAGMDDAFAPIKLDDDDGPAPQIILAGGEKPGGSAISRPSGSAINKPAAPAGTNPAVPAPSQTGERIFAPGELPRNLGKINHYMVVDHKDVVARWENDGRGWMIHLKDGFTRAATVENQIPQFGNFILIEVGVERRADGLHLKNITPYQLRRQYSLSKIAKGDDAILETIIDYAILSDRQRKHVKDLIKTKFLPHMWAEMEALLPPPAAAQ